jgi:hypothetical protein
VKEEALEPLIKTDPDPESDPTVQLTVYVFGLRGVLIPAAMLKTIVE